MAEHGFVKQYRDELLRTYETFALRLKSLIEDLLLSAHIDAAQIEWRAKTPDSLAAKIDRKQYTNPLLQCSDLAGLRVITYYPDDAVRIADVIRAEFDVDESRSADTAARLNEEVFGYRSIHMVVRLGSARAGFAEWHRYASMFAEVQIRSVLQHAWAAISHKLDYKSAAHVPPTLRRQLFRLSALLELADDQFTNLRDRSLELEESYRHDVARGELDIPLDRDSLATYLNERVELPKWARLGIAAGMLQHEREVEVSRATGIDRLLNTLQALGLKSIREVERLLIHLESSSLSSLSS